MFTHELARKGIPVNAVPFDKVQLRQQFMTLRKALSVNILDAQSQAISNTFFKHFDLSDIQSLHVFLPIRKFNEVNTWFIIHAIWQHHPHVTLIVPKGVPGSFELESYVLNPTTQIVENSWGIPEPVDAQPFAEAAIDVILVPLLCFDKRGYRVGYGKGFYDRFLGKCKPTSVRIGLSLFDPIEIISDIQSHDIQLDFCVLPNHLWSCDDLLTS